MRPARHGEVDKQCEERRRELLEIISSRHKCPKRSKIKQNLEAEVEVEAEKSRG